VGRAEAEAEVRASFKRAQKAPDEDAVGRTESD
jgi:hypothetical protein